MKWEYKVYPNEIGLKMIYQTVQDDWAVEKNVELGDRSHKQKKENGRDKLKKKLKSRFAAGTS